VDRHILFIAATLGIGGAERQWATLIRSLHRNGTDASVLTLYDGGPFSEMLRADGLKTESMGLSGRHDILALARSWTRVPSSDLVVSQSFAGQVVAQAIATRRRVPHVTAEHHGHGLPRRGHERAVLRLVAPMTTAVVAVSRSQIEDLVGVGYRRERIRVIPNGVAPGAVERSTEDVRAELRIPTNAFVAVLAATLRREKRPQLFIEAVVRANAVNDRVVGIVAGDGPELSRVMEMADATGGVVRAVGHRADIAEVMNAADVACLSSETEALPMAVLEAMALGKPAVAIDVGGVRDAVEDEETGMLARSADPEEFARALVRLADDPQLAARLGENARARQLRLFSEERMVSDYARLFDCLAVRPFQPIA
jgi:glycosyltransferase involved in cell wall biosynthesis